MGLWTLELASIDGHPITVQKIVTAILLVAIGISIAKRIAQGLSQRMLPKFGVSPRAGAALEASVFYGLSAVVSLIALEIVHVPLTVLTLFGGALAIGVGFGSQALVNNFISGLILLIERPIGVGDIVEIDGQQGRVLHIGTRSTRIITGNNICLIVPNSFFLDRKVVNLTFGDRTVRTTVSATASYRAGGGTGVETDPAIIIGLLTSIAKQHPAVLKTPEPVAVLAELSENGFRFELSFSIELNDKTVRSIVESEIRLQIVQAFAAKQFEFAQPQRVLHFDAVPLRVEIAENNR